MPKSALKTPIELPASAIQLLQTQRDWVQDGSRFKLGNFSRQTGKTFGATLECVLDVQRAEAEGKRSPWIILSSGERMAYQAMREGVYRHLHALDIGFKALSENETEFYDEDKIKRRGLELIFPKGNFIVAVPANPDTVRGYSGNMLFDEFSVHKDAREVWAAAYPIITRGYKARVIGTPKGKGNKFYELATSTDPVWKQYKMDIHEAVRQGAPLNIDELRRGLNDEDKWQQEYELQWLDEASNWLSFDLINGVENDHAGLPEHYNNGAVFVGVDIATRRDLFVVWVAELVGDVLWTREIIAKRRITFAEMDFHLDGVFQRYNVNRCVIDQTGMGEKFVEDAQRRHGILRIEGVLFTSPNKLTLATLGKTAFQDRKIRIPQGDDALRADLHKVKQETSATGSPRFVADSDSAGHADRFWAMCMAVHAAGKQAAPIDYVSVPKTSSARHEAVRTGGYSQDNDFEQD